MFSYVLEISSNDQLLYILGIKKYIGRNPLKYTSEFEYLYW